jgi:hypothetical protein
MMSKTSTIKHRVHSPGLIGVYLGDQLVAVLTRTNALVPNVTKPYRALFLSGDKTFSTAVTKLDYGNYKDVLAKTKALVAKYDARLAKKAIK